MRFSDFPLNEALLQGVADAGFERPTPIQERAVPTLLSGGDFVVRADTGTGKTAAYALPLLQRLVDSWVVPREIRVRALILAPVRELAAQIHGQIERFAAHLDLSVRLVHGGGESPAEQAERLRPGCDVLVATPGRLLDLIDRRALRLDQVETFVIDEADRMLDLGFAPDVRKIAGMTPASRQGLFFSATMPEEALRLARAILQKPTFLSTDPETAGAIEQTLCFVEKNNKFALLEWWLKRLAPERLLVFCRTRRGAARLAERLRNAGFAAGALHGDLPQSARMNALEAFRIGEAPILVATDVAARGLDVAGISHVIGLDLPSEPETYVHRIGRTARAGATGVAIAFCDATEKPYLRALFAFLGRELPVETDHPFHSEQIQRFEGGGGRKSKNEPRRAKGPNATPRRLTPEERRRLNDASPGKNRRRNPKRKAGR